VLFKNIKNLREDHEYKQETIAKYLHVMQTTYSKYELGKINIPIDALIKLADLYDVSLDYLVGRTVNREKV
jgi:transcriptional regulator with XRE-family HTH domain